MLESPHRSCAIGYAKDAEVDPSPIPFRTERCDIGPVRPRIVKLGGMHRTIFVALLIVSIVSITVQGQTPIGPKPPFTAKDVELGKKLIARSWEIQSAPDRPMTRFNPHEPFKILGNLYFVGVGNGEVFLLTSPQGHILFGTSYPGTPQLVEKNIETLGFKLTDIKAILISYWHWDNTGGAAYLKEKTGAAIMAGVSDIPFMERGGNVPPGALQPTTGNAAAAQEGPPGPQQPLPAGAGGFTGNNFKPFKVDRALFDGDQVKVGPLTITAYHTPGHTPGGMAWLYTVREGNRDYRVFQQGPTYVEPTPANIRERVGYSEAGVRRTFETFRKLLPVDIYLASPAFGFWMEDRLARLKAGDKMAFVDRSLFPAIIAAREIEFDEAFRRAAGTN
jgi:metallo-beta-lactamase class B